MSKRNIILNEGYNVMVHREELTGTRESDAVDKVSHKCMSL